MGTQNKSLKLAAWVQKPEILPKEKRHATDYQDFYVDENGARTEPQI